MASLLPGPDDMCDVLLTKNINCIEKESTFLGIAHSFKTFGFNILCMEWLC